jgi:predicted PurR-regulated permease PerM
MSVISFFSGIGLFALGVPLILANALLAGLLNFIPNVGPIFSVVPPIAIALLDAPWKAIAVLILYLLIQQVETNILTPLVMQKQVSLLPAATLISQLIFTIFFGFFGLLLALPLTIILQVLVQELWIKGVLDQV